MIIKSFADRNNNRYKRKYKIQTKPRTTLSVEITRSLLIYIFLQQPLTNLYPNLSFLYNTQHIEKERKLWVEIDATYVIILPDTNTLEPMVIKQQHVCEQKQSETYELIIVEPKIILIKVQLHQLVLTTAYNITNTNTTTYSIPKPNTTMYTYTKTTTYNKTYTQILLHILKHIHKYYYIY